MDEINVFILLLTLFESAFRSIATGENPTTPFWLTTEVRTIEWRRMCLTTAGCADPRLRLVEWNLISNEKISSSWSLAENNDQQRSFVSHWNHGTPADVTFGCEISGVDPMYGFPRTCDTTSAVRTFHHEPTKVNKLSNAAAEVNDDGKMIVELRGKCFNVSLAIQKHQTHCPWCSSPTELSLISQLTETESSRDIPNEWIDHEHLLSAGVITLALIAVLSSASFTCLLVAYLRRRALPRFAKKSRGYTACGASNILNGSRKPINASTRYTGTMNQRNPSSPYWMTANGIGTLPTTPSFNPPSVIITHSSDTSVLSSQSRIPIPPTISLSSNRHKDSGHESF
uniref:C2 domain-containing protein n=1 Tax=Ascaris suum TaxID=6253 RepID=F1L8F8_ASCSU